MKCGGGATVTYLAAIAAPLAGNAVARFWQLGGFTTQVVVQPVCAGSCEFVKLPIRSLESLSSVSLCSARQTCRSWNRDGVSGV